MLRGTKLAVGDKGAKYVSSGSDLKFRYRQLTQHSGNDLRYKPHALQHRNAFNKSITMGAALHFI
jgi:hypothetical protein